MGQDYCTITTSLAFLTELEKVFIVHVFTLKVNGTAYDFFVCLGLYFKPKIFTHIETSTFSVKPSHFDLYSKLMITEQWGHTYCNGHLKGPLTLTIFSRSSGSVTTCFNLGLSQPGIELRSTAWGRTFYHISYHCL